MSSGAGSGFIWGCRVNVAGLIGTVFGIGNQRSQEIKAFFKGVVFAFMVMVMSLPLSAAMAAPLHDAIEARDLEKVKELIAKGADVNAKNCDDAAPLHFAIGWGFENDVVELLIAKGADVNAKTKDGITPLRMTAFLGLQATAEFLIAKGADVNAKDKYGITSLHEAALWRHQATAELLIAKGADVNAKDIDGKTPLDVARINGHDSLVSILEDAMASSP